MALANLQCVGSVLLYWDVVGTVLAPSSSTQWSTASCVMVVYDVTVTDSFTSSAKWLRQLLDAREGKPLPGVLVANKVDLESDDRRVVSEEEGKETAAGFHLEYFETSALQASGVDAPFEALASGLASRWQAAKGALEAGDV